VLKRGYFMAVIDGVFCVARACYKQTRDVSTVTLEWCEITAVKPLIALI